MKLLFFTSPHQAECDAIRNNVKFACFQAGALFQEVDCLKDPTLANIHKIYETPAALLETKGRYIPITIHDLPGQAVLAERIKGAVR